MDILEPFQSSSLRLPGLLTLDALQNPWRLSVDPKPISIYPDVHLDRDGDLVICGGDPDGYLSYYPDTSLIKVGHNPVGPSGIEISDDEIVYHREIRDPDQEGLRDTYSIELTLTAQMFKAHIFCGTDVVHPTPLWRVIASLEQRNGLFDMIHQTDMPSIIERVHEEMHELLGKFPPGLLDELKIHLPITEPLTAEVIMLLKEKYPRTTNVPQTQPFEGVNFFYQKGLDESIEERIQDKFSLSWLIQDLNPETWHEKPGLPFLVQCCHGIPKAVLAHPHQGKINLFKLGSWDIYSPHTTTDEDEDEEEYLDPREAPFYDWPKEFSVAQAMLGRYQKIMRRNLPHFREVYKEMKEKWEGESSTIYLCPA